MSPFIHQTKQWISQFVIGYNLCPFAGPVFQKDQIRYVLVEGQAEEMLVNKTFRECLELLERDPAEVETVIIIHPEILTDFLDYLDVVGQMQEDLDRLGLAGVLQLATFHPDYQFAGTEPEDPENYTNRSPYPMIHILRENSVEKAINLHPDTKKIPQINIATMNKIGKEELKNRRNEIIRKN